MHGHLNVKFVRNHIKSTNIKVQAGHLQKKYALQVKDSENVYAELLLPHPFQIPFTNKSAAFCHSTQPDTQPTQYKYFTEFSTCSPFTNHTSLFQNMVFITGLKHSRTTAGDTFPSNITSHLITQLHMVEKFLK